MAMAQGRSTAVLDFPSASFTALVGPSDAAKARRYAAGRAVGTDRRQRDHTHARPDRFRIQDPTLAWNQPMTISRFRSKLPATPALTSTSVLAMRSICWPFGRGAACRASFPAA